MISEDARHILEFLRRTHSMAEILKQPWAEGKEQHIRKKVYALANSEALFVVGATSGALYRTAHIGYLLLGELDER